MSSMNNENDAVVARRAFSIFEDVIVTEISGENEIIRADMKRLEHLLEPVPDVVIYLVDKTVKDFTEVNGWRCADGKVARIKLFNCHIFLVKIPEPFFQLVRSIIIWKIKPCGRDNKLFLYVFSFDELGKLCRWCSILELVEPQDLQEPNLEYLLVNTVLTGDASFRPRATLGDQNDIFKVQSIHLEYNTELDEILRHMCSAQNVGVGECLHGNDLTESDQLRYDVARARTHGGLLEALMKKRKLRLEKKALFAFHNYLQTVEIKHSHGKFCFQLYQGRKENDKWVYHLNSNVNENSLDIATNNIFMTIEILLAGRPIYSERTARSGYGVNVDIDRDSGLLEIIFNSKSPRRTFNPTVSLIGTFAPARYEDQDEQLVLCVETVVFDSTDIGYLLPRCQPNMEDYLDLAP